MLSRNLEQTLHRALSLAADRKHEYATLEHLLLGLIDDADAITVLRACGVDIDKIRKDLTEFLDKDLAGLATEPVVSGSAAVPVGEDAAGAASATLVEVEQPASTPCRPIRPAATRTEIRAPRTVIATLCSARRSAPDEES